MHLSLVLATLLFKFTTCSWSWESFHLDAAGQELVAFAQQQHGAVAHAIVGKKCMSCVRGMYADKAIRKGDVVLSIPDSLTIDVSGNCPTGHICSLAMKLWYTDPGLRERHRLYFDSLPKADEVLCGEMFNETMFEALQSPHLVRGMRYYSERHDKANFQHIRDMIWSETSVQPPQSYADWIYLSSILTTRTFSFGNTAERLIPVADFINMAGQGENESHNVIYPIFNNETQTFEFIASWDIEAGEELKFKSYGIHTERADFALMIYGYVDDALLELDDPQLCASDLPSYDEELIWAGANTSDQELEEDLNHEQKKEALEVLKARLKEAEERESIQDALEALPGSTGWLREVIKFRIVRKKALAAAVKRLTREVELEHDEPCDEL